MGDLYFLAAEMANTVDQIEKVEASGHIDTSGLHAKLKKLQEQCPHWQQWVKCGRCSFCHKDLNIYFAHPVNTYGTALESALIVLATTVFSHSQIENPNRPHHQKGYRDYAKRYAHEPVGKNTRGMRYFHEVVLPSCDGCVAAPFLDGKFGLGVADETKYYLERRKLVWIVTCGHTPTAEDLRNFINNPIDGPFSIRPITNEEILLLLTGDPKLVIPHEETRLRTWKVYNRVKRPYEEAHLVTMPIPEGFYPQGKS